MCPPTPAYSICDIAFDVPANTPATAELNAEFRGPSHRTFLLRAFRVGPNRMMVRFSPFEAGVWDVRISSTLDTYHEKQAQFTATPSSSLGWIEVANVHHFRYTGGDRPAHLWLGDTVPDNPDPAAFDQWVSDRAKTGVNHLRIRVPNSIDERAFDDLDTRLSVINQHGIIADLVLTPPKDSEREARQRFFDYVIARCAARNATWVILDRYENYDHAHDLVREIATYLNSDPFHHLRTVGAEISSGPFADEPWMDIRSYGSPDWRISAVEDQIFPKPGVSEVRASSPDEFRRLLWNKSMSGSYPQAAATDAATLKYLEVWKQLLADSRFWDEEPFFDATGARGLSLPDTEYILYVEKAGPVTVQLERKHKWNGEWVDPLSGARTDINDFKQDSYSGTPPDTTHDWVLHIYREGHRESLKSFRFEARTVLMQEIEVDPVKVPFDIAQPTGDTLPFGKPVPFAAHLKKETRASREMIYLWTGEVTADDGGYRILGAGSPGTFQIPSGIIRHFPGTLHVRLYGLNALGKLYSVDQNYGVSQ